VLVQKDIAQDKKINKQLINKNKKVRNMKKQLKNNLRKITKNKRNQKL